MSLDNINLPTSIIPGLYKQMLVPQAGEMAAQRAPKEQPGIAAVSNTYKVLGNNLKAITIIVNFAGEIFLPDNHLQFLTRMLEACKLNLGDVAIINTATNPVETNRLKEQLKPTHVLLLGVEPVAIQLPLSFPLFKEQEYAGCMYLFTPPLNELNKDSEEGKLLKSKLWVCLRKMFNV